MATTVLFCDVGCLSPILPKLSCDEVHVWPLSLEQANKSTSELYRLLSLEERTRAASFRFDRDRRRFTVGRGMLRRILGLYVNTDPAQLEFYYGAYGKPYLKGYGSQAIQFNLSHSHELILYTFSRCRRVGIDVEHLRSAPDIELMARQFFPVGEKLGFKTLQKGRKTRAFLERWTKEEAKVKALGIGLNENSRHEHVTKPFDRWCDLEEDLDGGSWSVMPLVFGRDYYASLAVEGYDWCLRYFHPQII